MPRYVALFRGINVGKAKRIAMGDLRRLLESMGFARVETLLNSGNAIFDGAAEGDAKLAGRIHDAVLAKLKVDAHVVVKSEKDIAAMIAGNKLAGIATDPSRFLVAMTNNPKGMKALEAVAKSDLKPDVVHLGKHALYAWCPDGILESKAGVALLKNLADNGTTRNWATIRKIHDCMVREESK
jgi:uncharacterized protein (DUF1697 family)